MRIRPETDGNGLFYVMGPSGSGKDSLLRALRERLKPADPVLNDHLGDAYWRVNRRLEAHFQWNHARDMKPDPEDLPEIEKKIKDGLPDLTAGPAASGAPTQTPSSSSAQKEGGG